MANLMAYPSAAQGLSEGLQSGITLGIQMRKQREDEDNAVWQKQKFQEQQETQKTLTQIELNNKLLTTKGIANATKAKAWNDNNRLKMKLGGTDMGEITTWNPNTHDKLAGDLNSIYALTKDKAKPISLIEADKLMTERYMQALSDGELTKEEVDSIKEIAKTSQGMISKDAETQALSALSGSPVVAGYKDKAKTIPISVTPTEEDIKQEVSSNLPFIQDNAVKKLIVEKAWPKDASKEVSGGNEMENFLGTRFDGFYTNKGIRERAYSWISTPEGKKTWDEERKKLMALKAEGYPPIYNMIPTAEGYAPANIRTGSMGAPVGVGKPQSSEMITASQQINTLKETLGRVKSLYKDSYVGAVGGRVAGVLEKTVGVPTEQAQFNSDLAQTKNSLIYLMSGKQINETEYKRLLDQLPDKNLPPTVFKARLKNFDKTLDSIIENRQKNMGGYGVNKPLKTNTAEDFLNKYMRAE